MDNNIKMVSFAYYEIEKYRWRRRYIRVLTALVVAVVIIVAVTLGHIYHGCCGKADKAPTRHFDELPKAATERENAHPINDIMGVQNYERHKGFIL